MLKFLVSAVFLMSKVVMYRMSAVFLVSKVVDVPDVCRVPGV